MFPFMFPIPIAAVMEADINGTEIRVVCPLGGHIGKAFKVERKSGEVRLVFLGSLKLLENGNVLTDDGRSFEEGDRALEHLLIGELSSKS